MPATRIQCLLNDQSAITLTKPTVGEDFIAGMNLATGRWCLLPVAAIESIELRTLVAELDYPVNFVAQKLEQNLASLQGFSLQLFDGVSSQRLTLLRVHGCFAFGHAVASWPSEVVLNLNRISRIEVLLVENFGNDSASSGKVSLNETERQVPSVNHR